MDRRSIELENWQNSNGLQVREQHAYGGMVHNITLQGDEALKLGEKLLEWYWAKNRHAVDPKVQ